MIVRFRGRYGFVLCVCACHVIFEPPVGFSQTVFKIQREEANYYAISKSRTAFTAAPLLVSQFSVPRPMYLLAALY
jgi:hypothetical protein